MPLEVGDVCLRAAGRLNDTAQVAYTNTVLIPHAADAWDELKLELDLHGSLVIQKTASGLHLVAGQTSFNTGSILPSDMLEPVEVWERLWGSTDLYTKMDRKQWEPNILAADSLRYWTYRLQDIFTVGALSDRDIKIYYYSELSDLSTAADNLSVNHCKQFMVNRTAALAARFTGNNKSRADTLDTMADRNLLRLTRINAKAKQGTRARRKPFRIAKRGTIV